jgi:SNF2 family DNA or RNA helicase
LEIKNKKELQRLVDILESFEENKESGKFEGKLYSAFELESLFTSSEYYKSKFDQGFKAFLNEAKKGKVIEKIDLEKDYDFLRNYQREGIDWLYFLRKYHFGGILADDMGLGKTIQTLVMLEKNKIKNKPSIIIVPKSLLTN